MHFQELISTLQAYWNDSGCLLTQPYDVEKGAGTFNPTTFLRSLGPEPYHAAYVEPCRRPTDGRYGENPIRMQHYYQFQVVMKPNPDDFLERYLGSLEAIGITSDNHDIRFVHDDWESPTLGAWGLGWEVWADGMEITQFTYFQQVGGFELTPIMGEITYGLERLCMFLQDVDNVYDLTYNDNFSYGDIFRDNEIQFSKHNFEIADIALHQSLFRQYEDECIRLTDAGIPAPALDYCLKASHSFNLLDARGAVSVSERQGYILRVRNLARKVAEAWIASRETLGYPLRDATPGGVADEPPAPTLEDGGDLTPDKQVPLLVEVGVEEMPAKVFAPLLGKLPSLFETFLNDNTLTFDSINVYATPRRIVVSVPALQQRQHDETVTVKGPPLRIGRDKDGNWAPAAVGFARKNGLTVDNLEIRKIKDEDYIFATMHRTGESALTIISRSLAGLLAKIPWYKTMRWGTGTTRFVRPVKWLVVLLGDTVVPVDFGGIHAGNQSHGHRFMSPSTIEAVADFADFQNTLMISSVVVDHRQRRKLVLDLSRELAASVGLTLRHDDDLLDEITNLVEFPVPVLCDFNERYLKIPETVLISEMKHHQKYLALQSADGRLSNRFIAVANTTCSDSSTMKNGFEKVLRSRFADAEFFLREDMKRPLRETAERLKALVFQARLGSMWDKSVRIGKLALDISERLGMNTHYREAVAEIAELCKADLTTAMVGEFPDLQGEIGTYYAREQGVAAAIANGISQHYLPKSLTDSFPASAEAATVGLADRIDTLTGIFILGKIPTGSADPYGLRRACLTSIGLVLFHNFRLDIDAVIDASFSLYRETDIDIGVDIDSVRSMLLDFVRNRAEGLFQDVAHADLCGGYPADSILAVFDASTPWYDLTNVSERLSALSTFRERPDFDEVAATFKRANNIIRDGGEAECGSVDHSRFVVAQEKVLWDAVSSVRTAIEPMIEERRFVESLECIAPLNKPVNVFFDAVLVNDPDPEVRGNRRALVRHVVATMLQIADFSKLQDNQVG